MIELPPERTGHAAPPELAASRQATAQAAASGMWRTGAPMTQQVLNGVRLLRFVPPAAARGTVLHFHGGGYRLGCPDMLEPFASALAARCGVEIICPAYRLAPDFPFPAALHDARAVLAEIGAHRSGPLFISGDSAGGGLAASLAAQAVAAGMPFAGVILLSAWLDLTLTSPDYAANAATDALFSLSSATQAAAFYLQGVPANDPLVSPVFADLKGFPASFISVGAGEVLAGDSIRFAAALRAAGGTAVLDIVENMEHVAVTRGMERAGAKQTFDGVANFIDRMIGAAPQAAK